MAVRGSRRNSDRISSRERNIKDSSISTRPYKSNKTANHLINEKGIDFNPHNLLNLKFEILK
jgi:hypothetical protein